MELFAMLYEVFSVMRKSSEMALQEMGHHGGGHHGRAWKVAYADFVTAMMALFIALWGSRRLRQEFKAGLAHYFREPGVFTASRGIIPNDGQDKLGAGVVQAPSLEILESYLKKELGELKDLVN